MSGHSKWANIKRTKAKVDEQKGKVFSKVAREIIVAVRKGGPSPEGNFRLRTVIQKAREANMPVDNINRAIQKGAGDLEGASFEELTYEGYGPGGAAVLVEALTENRNRTASEVRYIFSRNGGNLGEAGCVGWMFTRRGLIALTKRDVGVGEDDLLLQALEAGAEDVQQEGDNYEILTAPEQLDAVRQALERAGQKVSAADITLVPQSTVELRGSEAQRMLRLMETLEDHEDVQRVHSNFDIPEDELARLQP